MDTQCNDNSIAGLNVDDNVKHVAFDENDDMAEKANVALGESCSGKATGAENCQVKGKKRG